MGVHRRRPHAGVAVRLELQSDRELVALRRVSPGLALHGGIRAEQRLHVVPDLVSEHVGLREVARGPEPPMELAEEPQIQIHETVRRTVERTGRGRGDPAARIDPIGEQDDRGVPVRPPGGTEDVLIPHRLDIVDHRVHELREGSLAPRAGVAGGRLVRASEVRATRDVEPAAGAELKRQHDDDEQDDGAHATTDRERDPAEAPAAVAGRRSLTAPVDHAAGPAPELPPLHRCSSLVRDVSSPVLPPSIRPPTSHPSGCSRTRSTRSTPTVEGRRDGYTPEGREGAP